MTMVLGHVYSTYSLVYVPPRGARAVLCLGLELGEVGLLV